MTRPDARKLLGGYATGTLTPEERQALYEAALEDQELFDALAHEQPLRDLLGDPTARAHLLAALGESPAGWRQRLSRWVWGHAVGVGAVACFVVMGIYIARQAEFAPERVRMIAEEPTSVEVTAPAKPRRAFDLNSAINARPTPELPAPPAVGRRSARPLPKILASAPPAIAQPVPPARIPISEAQPTLAMLDGTMTPPPSPASPSAVPAAPRTGVVRGVAAPKAPQEVTVTAEAPQTFTTPSEKPPARLERTGQAMSAVPTFRSNLLRFQQTGGVSYHILLKQPNGEFKQVTPGQDLAAGDTIKFEFNVGAPGVLYVTEIGPAGGSGAAGAARPLVPRTFVQTSFTTPEYRAESAGQRQFMALFTQGAAGGAQGGSGRLGSSPAPSRQEAGPQGQTAPADSVMFDSVSAVPGQPTSLLITLTYR